MGDGREGRGQERKLEGGSERGTKRRESEKQVRKTIIEMKWMLNEIKE